ncbi:MAG: hypothetical protein AB7N76_33995 [Planctomycetota bacterium]
MADETWRAAERRALADPADAAAIAGMRRAGEVPPAALLDAELEPARELSLELPLEVWAVLPDGSETVVGWGPGTIQAPACRAWGISCEPTSSEDLRAAGRILREQRIPGLRVAKVAMQEPEEGWQEEDLRLEAIQALGRLDELRWLELPEQGSTVTTPTMSSSSSDPRRWVG